MLSGIGSLVRCKAEAIWPSVNTLARSLASNKPETENIE